jgi:transcriptional regulator with XRE-family HTH domain
MSSRSKIISKLLTDNESRESYLRAKLNQIVPSQIRALRLRENWTQGELGDKAHMKQSRVSAIETPGEVSFNLDTLIRLAATFRVALEVQFVSHSDMISWENNYSQDTFKVTPLDKDSKFISPEATQTSTDTHLQLNQLFGLCQDLLITSAAERNVIAPQASTPSYAGFQFQNVQVQGLKTNVAFSTIKSTKVKVA